MKSEFIGDWFVLNGDLKSTEDDSVFNEIVENPIYEVIRVINGVPLFFEEHLNRMKKSASIVNSSLTRDEASIREDIKKLIFREKISFQNIKLLSTNIKSGEKVFLIYSINSFYPPKEYYTKGINTVVIEYERENPNAKVQFSSFKQTVTEILKEKDAFEALLVNKKGYIAEGSRSNIFFVSKDKIYTAKSEDVLLGITREHIFNIAKKLNIDIIEENIHVDDIEKLDGAFMTGTSVNILPISCIYDKKLQSIYNKIIIEINNAYLNEMENYVLKSKKDWIKDI